MDKTTATIELLLHGLLVERDFHEEAIKCFDSICQLGGINVEIPSSKDKLHSIDNLVKVFDTKEDKINILDLLFRLVVADGVFKEGERAFLKEVYAKLGLPENLFDEFVDAVEKTAEGQRIWLDLKRKI
jgi:hypothetical protein